MCIDKKNLQLYHTKPRKKVTCKMISYELFTNKKIIKNKIFADAHRARSPLVSKV